MISLKKRLLISSLFAICAISNTTNAMNFQEPIKLMGYMNLAVIDISKQDATTNVNNMKQFAMTISILAKMCGNNCIIYEKYINDPNSRIALAHELGNQFQPYQLIEKIPVDIVKKTTNKTYMFDILNQVTQFQKIITPLAQSAIKFAPRQAQQLMQCSNWFAQYASNLQLAIENFTSEATPIQGSDQNIDDLIKTIIHKETQLCRHCQPFTQTCKTLDLWAQELKLQLSKTQEDREFDAYLERCMQLLIEKFKEDQQK